MKNKKTAIMQSIIVITFAVVLSAFNGNVFADCGQCGDSHDHAADIVEVADHAGPVSYTHLTLPTNREV